MFVLSLKTSKRQLWSFLICAVGLIAILLTALLWHTDAPAKDADAKAADNSARVSYLKSLGYEVDLSYCEVREVLIPDEFDETFLQYNELQKKAGMDLQPYHGKRLKCWSYRLINGGEGEVLAHLYLYKDKIVGGDISDTVSGSDMLPLAAKA